MKTKGGSEPLFTNRHWKLLNMARACEIFAWISLVVSVLHAGSQFYSYLNFSTQPNIGGILLSTPILSDFARALAVFVALLGISMGLRMIIDTDLNYRLRKEENSNAEQ